MYEIYYYYEYYDQLRITVCFIALKSKKNEYIWEEVHTISNLY